MKCTICNEELYGLTCDNEWCGEVHYECSKCSKVMNGSDAYEYRGAIACSDCFEEVEKDRERQRQEIIAEESKKTEPLKGLDLDPRSSIGKATRTMMSQHIEIAGKESGRLKEYEGRE